MGLFTYRQSKKTRREVHALRADQAQQAAAARDTALFQQLPPEGKTEFRAIEAEFVALGPLQKLRRVSEFQRRQQDLYRRYDLIP